MVMTVVLALVIGYLLGSLPFGYLVARTRGVNIFEVGSRNPGATNVRRVLGRGPGNLVFILDVLKGAVAAAWPMLPYWISRDTSLDNGTPAAVAGLVGAMLGHSYSCFTKFRGGKGVATGAGGLLVVFPVGTLIALALWGVVLAITRYVSLSSMLAAVSLPVSALLLPCPPVIIGVSLAIAVFVVVRHRTNISRLLAGTESRIGRKTAEPKA
jgi:acyl phosphate:glycerol-3-phosphate acyltransferase